MTIASDVQALQQLLQTLQQQVSQANPDVQALQTCFLAAQQYFQNGLLPGLCDDRREGDAAPSSAAGSILVEMDKQFRLLAMDVSFLRVARQPMTQQQRQRQMIDRLTLLQTYCEGLL